MNFKQWLKDVEIENIRLTHERNRAVYKAPNGTVIWQDEYVPHNFFKKSSEITYVDLIVETSKENEKIIKNLGGYIDTNIYTLEGYGHPVFGKGNSETQLKTAFEFVNEYKDKFVKNSNKNIFAE